MALFEELMGLMKAMGLGQIAMILLLVGLILLFLIFSAIKRGSNKDKPDIRETQRTPPTFEPVSPQHDNKIEPAVTPAPPEQSAVEIKASNTDAPKTIEQQGDSAPSPSDMPEDSILRRHYETLHKVADISDERPSIAKSLSDESNSTIEQVVSKQTQLPIKTVAAQVHAIDSTAKYLPEDSILKRHFIHQLKTEIQAGMSARPSDSVLKRHYDTHICHELARRLAD